MKKTLVWVLLLLVLAGQAQPAFGLVEMTDLSTHWIGSYQTEIYLLQHLTILNGYEDGTFRPDRTITREEFVKLLVTALRAEAPVDGSSPVFADVPPERWSYAYIQGAVAQGWIGLPDRETAVFEPALPITREEMAGMIGRALGGGDQSALSVFIDQGQISSDQRPYVAGAVAKGILRGYETGEGVVFRPQQTATRAEAALMLVRLLDQAHQLSYTGFYALDSYKQVTALSLFDQAAYGWAALTEKEDGTIGLSLTDGTTGHQIPTGYEIPLAYGKEAGAAPLLMVTEARTAYLYRLLASEAMQAAFIDDLVTALAGYGFQGVVMDWENMRDTDQGYAWQYAQFLERLKAALTPGGYQLTVAVQPRNVAGYYDGYDYGRIGQVADEVLLMAYDYYARSALQITDHAPLPKVKEALEDLLQQVPREKVVLGLQLAGGTQLRVSGQERNLYTPTMTAIYQALTDRQGERSFDYTTMTPAFFYQDRAAGQLNYIRYEDERSLWAKLLLARYYGIKGISVWRIGEIQPAHWGILEK